MSNLVDPVTRLVKTTKYLEILENIFSQENFCSDTKFCENNKTIFLKKNCVLFSFFTYKGNFDLVKIIFFFQGFYVRIRMC